MPRQQAHIERWHVWLAFLLLAAAATGVGVWVQGIADNADSAAASAQRLAHANQARINEIGELRRERVRLSAATDLKLCREANRQNSIIDEIIRGIEAAGGPSNPRVLPVFERAQRRLKPLHCMNLPSQKPDKKKP